MLLARWLTHVKNRMLSARRSRPRRYESPLSWDWELEDRTLLSSAGNLYPMPANNQATAVTGVVWNGGTWVTNPTKSTPTPPSKWVTIQNNTQQIIYPVIRDANTATNGGIVYDPADTLSQEYRMYIGFTTAGGTYLGLPPGASITFDVPVVYWNAENGFFITDGQNLVPASGAANPYTYVGGTGSNLMTNSVRYTTRSTTSGKMYIQSFSTPGGNPDKATGGAVMFYHTATAVGFAEGALAQLTEWTIRDPYLGTYFGITGNEGSQNIFDYDISYVNDALMPITAEATNAQGSPNGQTTGNYGYAGSTINFLNNPSDPANSPSMQALINEFIANSSSLPDGGLGSYFNDINAPTTNPGWPAFYNPNNPNTYGNIIPSGANLFTQSPLQGTVTGGYGPKSPYNQNQWALTSSGTGPISATPDGSGGTTTAGSGTTISLTFNNSTDLNAFVTNINAWVASKTAFTVTTSTGTLVANGSSVTGAQATGAQTATISFTTSITTGVATWLFTRTPSDYAAQQIASIWYAWANYYINTVLKDFNGAKYTGTYQQVPGGTSNQFALVLDKPETDLMPGMVVTGGGLPAGTTIAYISPTNNKIIYLSKNPTATTDVQYTFSKPATGATGLLPFTNSANLYTINLSGFKDTSQAAAFAAVVYETMVFENQSTFAPATTALGLVGKVIGADLAPGHFPGSNAYTVEHVLRDDIKSILRGVPDFTLPQYSSESTWYPNPSQGTGGQTYNAYNIDPFVWFVHKVLDFSGYGFSIDDDTGNVQAFTSSLVMTIGGPSGLPNKTPWSNQVQFGQQIAMAQILPPAGKYVPPGYGDYNLLLLQNQSLVQGAIKQINGDSDLGPGAAVTGTGIPTPQQNNSNPVRVLAIVTDAENGMQVLVLNTKAAKVTPKGKYVRLIFTSKGTNAATVDDEDFTTLQNSPNLGPNWTNMTGSGYGGFKISNGQAVGNDSGSYVTDEAWYSGPNSSLTNVAVASVVSISNTANLNSEAGVFARRDSNNDFYAALLVHDTSMNSSSDFVELARYTPGVAGTVGGGWTYLQVMNLPSSYFSSATASVELQLEVLGVGLHTSLQLYVKNSSNNQTILTLSWTEGDAIYQFPSPYNGGVQTYPLNGPGTTGLLTFFAGGAFTNFTVFQLIYNSLNPGTTSTLLQSASPDADDAFVQTVYQALLDRPADGSAEYWVTLLEEGVSPVTVVQDIEASTEYLDDEVNDLYEHYLQRPADTAGQTYYVGLLQTGTTIEQVIDDLVSSTEYYNDQGGTNQDFVASLYTNILGRTGSTTEVQGWVNAMAGGMTPAQVANAFLTSPEYRQDLITSYYQNFLGRTPSAAESAYWVNVLNQGVSDQVVEASIIGSQEGFADFSSEPTAPIDGPNTAYVTYLYENLLGRSPDAGASYWVNLLDTGTSPVAVVEDIEATTEYLDDLVNSLYEQYLQRPADPAGLSDWVGLLQDGGTVEQVIDGLVSSTEYYNDQGGTNQDFVASLYTNILGRSGSSTEIQGWVNAMAGGMTPAQVANAFLTSQEYRTDLVESYYQTYLNRPADSAGLAYFLNELNQGVPDQVVLASILGSSEAYGLYS